MSSAPAHPTGRSEVAPVRLGWWRRRVNPLLLDRIMDTDEARSIRERVCAPLAGDVLEIGFGSGLNLPHLPSAVQRVYAVDPLERSWELAAPRVASCAVPADRIGPDARAIPLPDRSVDAVLCTWNLCSIDDAHIAVAEIARCCDREASCTSWSTAGVTNRVCVAGSIGVTRCGRGSPAGAIWTGTFVRPSTPGACT